MDNEPKNNKAMMAGVLAVVGLLVGGGIGYAIGHNGSSNESNDMAMTQGATSDNSMKMSSSEDGVTVGGAKMVRSKDIVDNAANAKNVSTVVAAVKAAGLVDTLKSEGPFTVFAPNNAAFEALPAGTVDTLLKPESKDALVKVLTYHVVPGTYTAADLKVMASKGETLKTVQGGTLTIVSENNEIKIQDAMGKKVSIETPDVISSNGVTHVIKSVLMSN